MTHHLLEERLVFIYVEGLAEPLRGIVKVSSSRSLDDAIQATYDLEPIVKSLRGGSVSKGPTTESHIQRGLARPRLQHHHPSLISWTQPQGG